MTSALARFTGPGVSPIETLRAQSGLDFLRGMLEGRMPRPPISDTLNFYLVEVERGRAVFQGTPKPDLLQPARIDPRWLDRDAARLVHGVRRAHDGAGRAGLHDGGVQAEPGPADHCPTPARCGPRAR